MHPRIYTDTLSPSRQPSLLRKHTCRPYEGGSSRENEKGEHERCTRHPPQPSGGHGLVRVEVVRSVDALRGMCMGTLARCSRPCCGNRLLYPRSVRQDRNYALTNPYTRYPWPNLQLARCRPHSLTFGQLFPPMCVWPNRYGPWADCGRFADGLGASIGQTVAKLGNVCHIVYHLFTTSCSTHVANTWPCACCSLPHVTKLGHTWPCGPIQTKLGRQRPVGKQNSEIAGENTDSERIGRNSSKPSQVLSKIAKQWSAGRGSA